MVSKFRGAQVSPRRTAEDMHNLVNMKVNIIRNQITTYDIPTVMDADLYKGWVNFELDLLDELLPIIEGKIKVVIDIHTAPGGATTNASNMFKPGQEYWQEVLLDVWRSIAHRYKNNPTIHVYGILNEPMGNNSKVIPFMKKAVATIRAIDSKKKISVTNSFGTPDRFKNLPLFPGDPNIWYETHMYFPATITYQGLNNRPYPVVYPNAEYQFQDLINQLKKVRDFQLAHNAPIYVGEFSISKFASVPTRKRYLEDLIKIFETYGFRWTYHAWHESEVWDLEPYPTLLNFMKRCWAKNTQG